MPEHIKITVEDILEKKGKGDKPYWVLRNNGDGFFAWEKELMEGVEKGKTYEFDIEPGKYPKILSKPKLVDVPAAPEKPKEANAPRNFEDVKSLRINRAVALQTATEIYKSIVRPSDDPAAVGDGVKKLAAEFEAWLNKEKV